MEIEKKLIVAAPRERVWALLMDPQVMTGAVPGMQSIEVISPTEYVALMKVKISFISAKFKLHTQVVEQREPEYLRVEGTGEDASVASSLRQTSEVSLISTPEGGTELGLKVRLDLLGRLGTFGLSVMKTKADRMWDEFSRNLAERIDGRASGAEAEPAVAETSNTEGEAAGGYTVDGTGANPRPAARAAPPVEAVRKPSGWVARILGMGRPCPASGVIRVEIRQSDRIVAVEWPVEAADQCQDWLRELLMRPV